MHTRDYPGGHVFIRPPKGKSPPLEILLDAGNLALSYSKAPGTADMYYTQVKYLRRPGRRENRNRNTDEGEEYANFERSESA